MIRRWNELPPELQVPELKKYYRKLYRKRGSLLIKRAFDVVMSLLLLILLSPVMIGVAIWIGSPSMGRSSGS